MQLLEKDGVRVDVVLTHADRRAATAHPGRNRGANGTHATPRGRSRKPPRPMLKVSPACSSKVPRWPSAWATCSRQRSRGLGHPARGKSGRALDAWPVCCAIRTACSKPAQQQKMPKGTTLMAGQPAGARTPAQVQEYSATGGSYQRLPAGTGASGQPGHGHAGATASLEQGPDPKAFHILQKSDSAYVPDGNGGTARVSVQDASVQGAGPTPTAKLWPGLPFTVSTFRRAGAS